MLLLECVALDMVTGGACMILDYYNVKIVQNRGRHRTKAILTVESQMNVNNVSSAHHITHACKPRVIKTGDDVLA